MLIHRLWIGPPDPGHEWTAAVIRSLHPEPLTDHTLDTLPAPVTERVQTQEGDDPRHLANVARYALLHQYGGLWLDHDVLPLERLTGSPTPWTASIGARRAAGVLWFPAPGHPVLADLLDVATTADPTLPTPARSGADPLNRLCADHDIGREPAVIPFDRVGTPARIAHPRAVTTWSSSWQRGTR